MKEYKWSVGLRHKATREKLNVTVWASKNEDATHKLCGVLIGPECEYEWTGTGPVYENNQRVERGAQTAQIPEVAYPIPQPHLTAAVEGLQDLVRRMEADAAAFAMIATREGALRAAELLEQAEIVRQSADFFLHL